jgi:hypothetical protein
LVQDAAWLRAKVSRIAAYEIELTKVKPEHVINAQALLAKMIPGALEPDKVELGGGDNPLTIERIERVIVEPTD